MLAITFDILDNKSIKLTTATPPADVLVAISPPSGRSYGHAVSVRTQTRRLVWRAPPGWPEAPTGWQPPPGWSPPSDWPAPPSDWQFWMPVQPQPAAPVRYREPTRRDLV